MKKIIRYIIFFIPSILLWIFWWFNAIISISLLITVSLFVPKKFYNLIARIVCKILMYCIFIFPLHKGLKPKDVPYPVIYVANHISFFDLFISGSVLPGYPRGLEMEEHFSKPVYGWFIKKFGQIPINTKKSSSIKQSFETASNILKNKIRSIFIMPEGTRTMDGNIKKFRSGAFYLSKKSGVAVVPVVYKKLFNRNNRKSILIIPGLFDVIIMPPVFPENFKSEDQMAAYIRDIMQNKLEE